MAGILATGAGAASGLEDFLMQMMKQQQMDETVRSNTSREDISRRQVDETAGLHREQIRTNNLRQQSMDDDKRRLEANRVRDDKRAALDDLMPGVMITPQTRKEALESGAAAPERFQEERIPEDFTGPIPEGEPQRGEIQGFSLIGKPAKGATEPNLQRDTYLIDGQPVDVFINPHTRELRRVDTGEVVPQGKAQHYEKPTPAYSPIQSEENYIRFNRKTGKYEDGTGKEVPNPGLATPAATRTREDLADRVGSHFDDIQLMLDDAEKRGLLGPMSGRTFLDFMAGKVGTTGNAQDDELIGELRMNMSLARSGLAQLHGRGGANVGMIQALEKKMDEGHMDYGGLTGGLRGMKSWVDTYAKKKGAAGAEQPKAPDAYDEYLKRKKKP